MSAFFFSRKNRRLKRKPAGGQTPSRKIRCPLSVEKLEDRTVPSVISGYVFNDLNNNGIPDPGELGLANSTIQLRNAAGVVIGTTVTDGNGFYQFATDSTISTAPTTLTETASIPNSATDWTQGVNIPQFDPSLGTLTSVDITNSGTFTSRIQVESLDSAPSTITGTVSGSETLTGLGITGLVTTGSSNETFNATAFDGIIDFGGTSGHDFGPQTAPGTQSTTISAASALAPYIGTGSVTFTEVAHATSSASGAGNLVTRINSSASANVTVVYHYIPSNALRPGNYTIVQTTEPPGYLDGKDSSGGVVIPNSVGTDTIPVTLGTTDSLNNDFGEIAPASLSGFVYVDSNDNGVKDSGEIGIAGVTVTLAGTNDLGPVNLTLQTGADGSYLFGNLRPGTYTITETPPANYLDGKDAVGSAGGALGNSLISAISLNAGVNGINYNFAALLPSSLSGFVYFDANNNGAMDPGEPGIPGTSVTLTGTNDLGGSVNVSQATGADGSYHFTNLRPGNYTISEAQPAGYLEGTNTVGSLGGQLGPDQFLAIAVGSNAAGVNYNFGEVIPASVSGYVYLDMNDNGTKDSGEVGISGVTITLTGTDVSGHSVSLSQTTGVDGSYHFMSLMPRTYIVTETPPANYIDGKVSVGSVGGTVGSHQISAIQLGVNVSGLNYNFGELLPSTLSGFVYLDRNDNGVFDYGESGIAGITVTLTGTNDLGQPVSVAQTTGADGSYLFAGLRPGSYTITKTPPSAYLDGRETLGSAGGMIGNDQFTGISLPMGIAGVSYNFGELLPPSPPGVVYSDFGSIDNVFSQPPNFTIILSKLQLIYFSNGLLDPVSKANAYFVDALYRNVLGRPSDSPGLTGFVLALDNGATRAQVVQAIWESPEHRAIEVEHLYQTFLRREPDAASWTGWVNAMLNGMSEANVALQLILSPEYQSTRADNSLFVASLYADVLGRVATGSEISSWTQALQNGLSRTSVATAFLTSAEVDKNIVDNLYNDFLRRAADPMGEQAFVSGITNHQFTMQAAAEVILGSDEYYAMAVRASQAV